MLRVTTLYAASATATARYYTRYLAQAPGEEPGRWMGRQAEELGLSGEVDGDAMEPGPRRRPSSQRLAARCCPSGSPDGGWAGCAGCGGLRCDVLGAEVTQRVGADGRRRPAACARCSGGRRTGVPGALRRYHPDQAPRPPRPPRRRRAHDRRLPADDVPRGRSADPHPRRDLRQGPDARWAVVGPRRTLPQAAPADAGRPVPGGAAGRAVPPLRNQLGTDRQRAGRDRPRRSRAARPVLEAVHPGGLRSAGHARRLRSPGGARSDQGRACRIGAGGGSRHSAPQVWTSSSRPSGPLAGGGGEAGLDADEAHLRSYRAR